ncbi:uncharacterized protein LOC144573072 isoform X2 [Carex rostrata]
MLPPDRPRYRLDFINQVKSPAFTTRPVDPIEVAIYDTNTQSIISPDCFLSSAKVKLIVLNALFWKNKGANWSRSDFNQSVLSKREGKPPILTGGGGSLTIRLQHGRGTFENIIFTDNSSWSNGEFRLGITLEGVGEEGYLNGERVQEGVSKPIRVKDRRGIAFQPDRLELRHSVRCIKKIGKDRASLLQKKGINTVENFLSRYYNDQSELREILCIKSESDKGWMSMVKHMIQCANEFRAKNYALNNCSQPRQVSMNNEANILNPDTNQFYFEYLINNNIKSISPLEEVLHRRTSHQDQFSISSKASVHMPERIVLPQTNGGPRLVGSGSSVPNPCENNLLIPDTSILNVGPVQHKIAGVLQIEVSSDSGLLDNLLATSESTTNNYFQSPSRSNSFDASLCEALVQGFITSMSNGGHVGQLWPRRMAKIKIPLKLITFLVGPRSRARIGPPPIYQPQQSLVHLMGRNKSICINVGPHVVGSGSSGQIENDIIGDMPAFYEQLPAICDIALMNLLNEHISTSSGEHIVETQHSLFHETNHVNVERGNILNGDSMQRTDDGGSPQLELSSDYIPMEYPYATDVESTSSYSTQIPSRSENFECFTGSMSNSVDVGPPLPPRKKRRMMAFVRSVAFLAVPRKRARIVPPANQMTVAAI